MLASLTGCGKEKVTPQKTLVEPVSLNAESATATYRDMEQKKIITGQVVPETVDLCFEVNGSFGEFYVQIGDKVKEGDKLATLDTSTLEDNLTRLEEEKEKARLGYEGQQAGLNAQIKEYEVTLEQIKNQEVVKNPKEVKKQIELVKEQLNLSQQLKELELGDIDRKITEAKEAKTHLDLVATCDGVVVEVANLWKYNNVGTDTIVLTIALDEKPYLSTEFIGANKMKECVDYYAIVGGQEYKVDYLPLEKIPSSTIFLSKVETTKFEFKDNETNIAIGDYAILVLVENRLENVLTVPSEAVYEDISGQYVYVINGDSRYRQSVDTGLEDSYGVEIKSGLEEGDEVYVKN
jgi:macrolide-specific efflux system membrane fusion protein